MASYTVTATATNNTFDGGLLQVEVLDNAAVAASPATGSSTTAYNCSVSTTTDGSYVFGVAYNASAQTTFTAESNCTKLTDYSNATSQCEYATFRTTNTTSGTPGATTVGFSTAFATYYGACAMEILASGGTLTIDGSSPAAVDSATATSFTTASFSPPGGTVLVAMFAVTGNFSAATCAGTVSSTPSLTWTQRVAVTSNVGGVSSCIGVWTAVVPAAAVASAPPQALVQPPVVVASVSGWRNAGHSR